MARRFPLVLVLGLIGLASAAGCGRDFDHPPPEVEIVGFSPREGFEGARVAVCGRNLGTARDDFSLLAYFGSQPAAVIHPLPEVQQPSATDLPCDGEWIGLIAPELPPLSEVPITLSTASGQATSGDAFRHLGPGHPPAEMPGESLRLAVAPSSVSVLLPDERLPVINPVLVTNTAARSLTLMDLDTGWHVDFGVDGMPLSAALVPGAATHGQLPPEEDGSQDPRTGVLYRAPLFVTARVVEGPTEPGGHEVIRSKLYQRMLILFVPDGSGSNPFEVYLKPLTEDNPMYLGIPAGDDLEPDRVRSFCLTTETTSCLIQGTGAAPNPICTRRMLAVTDARRPRLALYEYLPTPEVDDGCERRTRHLATLDLSPQGSPCLQAGEEDGAGAIVDLAVAPTPEGLFDSAVNRPRLHVAVANRPEVWTIEVNPLTVPWTLSPALSWPTPDPRAAVAGVTSFCADNPALPVCADNAGRLAALGELVAWHDQIASGIAACQLGFSALAIQDRREESDALQRAFFSDPSQRTVFEAEYVDVSAVWPNTPVTFRGFVPYRSLSVPSPVYAMTAGHDGLHHWLVMACEDGVRATDADLRDEQGGLRPLRVDAFTNLPGSRGTPLSLTRYGQGDDTDWDYLILADTVRDQLLRLPMGQPVGDPLAFPAGPAEPQVAASQFEELLYVADPRSNTIRLVDEHSGMLAGQIPVRTSNSFGARDIASLHLPQGDVLLVPVGKSYVREPSGRQTFDSILSRGAEVPIEVSKTPPEEFWEVGAGEGIARNEMLHPFNELLVAPRSQQYVLVDYAPSEDGEHHPSGLVWTALTVADDIQNVGVIDDPNKLPSGTEFSQAVFELPEKAQLVRLDPGEQALVAYGLDEDDAGWIGVYTMPRGDLRYALTLPPPNARLVSDVAIRVVGDTITVYLALPSAGTLMALRPYRAPEAASDSFLQALLETTGVPERLFWSPDGRRLYVTHRTEGLLSVVDTDCLPEPECAETAPCADGTTCAYGRCGDVAGCPDGTEWAIDAPGMFCVPSLCDRVRANLAVPANPERVVFHPSGQAAYLTHAGSGDITVIR